MSSRSCAAAGIYGSTEFNYSGYTVAALLFLALTIPMTRFTDHLIARDRARRLAGVRERRRPRTQGRREALRGPRGPAGVSLALHRHEVVCLIGASGSGKSTLLRCANLLEPVDAGDITLFGQSLRDSRIDPDLVRRHIGSCSSPSTSSRTSA